MQLFRQSLCWLCIIDSRGNPEGIMLFIPGLADCCSFMLLNFPPSKIWFFGNKHVRLYFSFVMKYLAFLLSFILPACWESIFIERWACSLKAVCKGHLLGVCKFSLISLDSWFLSHCQGFHCCHCLITRLFFARIGLAQIASWFNGSFWHEFRLRLVSSACSSSQLRFWIVFFDFVGLTVPIGFLWLRILSSRLILSVVGFVFVQPPAVSVFSKD